jgi:GNAT superfamily N-acetyltransferase
MVTIEKIDPKSKSQVNRFIRIPFQLYEGNPQWVPPLDIDSKIFLNHEKHPFYEHSEADFFIAVKDGHDVGRICALVNHPYNNYHDKKQALFYFFDCAEDLEIATRLFDRVFEWAHKRGLTELAGPKGMGPLDGYGLLIDGFEHRQMMTMMNYNYPYYPKFIEQIGFQKEVDFVSCYLSSDKFQLDERIHRIAGRVIKRGSLGVHRFKNKNDLKAWANRIGKAYNQAFIDNWEYYPLSDNEVKFILDNILMVADPKLIKVITHDDDVVGFLLGFPDVSAALQRANGKLLPLGIFDLLINMRRTNWISLNGAGILPEFQGRGGNALLYSEMEKTVKDYNFEFAEMTQIAESAVQMRRDLINLGGEPYKNHRVFIKNV